MPEYLAPAVYVEETSFRSKSIEGVSTSTAAFVGPTARGPLTVTGKPPPLLTSFADYEQTYGGVEGLTVTNGGVAKRVVNYVAHAARAFFDNGGGRLYVARIAGAGSTVPRAPYKGDANSQIAFVGRYPVSSRIENAGDANLRVTLIFTETETTVARIAGMPAGTLLRIHAEPPQAGSTASTSTASTSTTGPTSNAGYGFLKFVNGAPALDPVSGTPAIPTSTTAAVSIVSVTAQIEVATGQVIEYPGLGLHPDHPRAITTVLAEKPPRAEDALTNPVMLTLGTMSAATASDRLAVGKALAAAQGTEKTVHDLTGGSDGTVGTTDYSNALEVLGALEDISIIAAPGVGAYEDTTTANIARAVEINSALITAAEAQRAYRIAVLDTPPGIGIGEVRAMKGKLDSKHAALYYPWVTVANPLAGVAGEQPREVLPPSGFVCGVYARTDVDRGVWKPPANETVLGAVDLERVVSFGEQELLNPLGVNCIRLMPNRGYRVWGARTVSSDPEWKYVNVRRYFLYLESSIDRGTQWAVFEPNGERLWANVRETVFDFLYNEWVNGALLGTTPKEAFFVRCDRSTMTQNDLDNGRLICLIGVAAIKPAEFVIFRIGQKTAGPN